MEHTSEDRDRHQTASNGHRPPNDSLDKEHDRQSDRLEPSPTVQRFTVPEAAEILCTTTDAVRSRMRRGKLRREEGEDGTVYVLLEGGASRRNTDGPETVGGGHKVVEDRQETVTPTVGDGRGTVEDGLVEVLSDQVSYLREQLDKEREANRENRRLLAAALERIPELEPAREPSSEVSRGSETASSRSGGGAASEDAQEATEHRSWWRRFFGIE